MTTHTHTLSIDRTLELAEEALHLAAEDHDDGAARADEDLAREERGYASEYRAAASELRALREGLPHVPELARAVRRLLDALDADVFTDAPECRGQLRLIDQERDRARWLLQRLPSADGEPARPDGGLAPPVDDCEAARRRVRAAQLDAAPRPYATPGGGESLLRDGSLATTGA